MTSEQERLKKLVALTREMTQHIDWLLPFLDKKARESGDVAGLQLNAKDAADRARKFLNFIEAEDAVKAKDLSK
jgi:hypothetical protein